MFLLSIVIQILKGEKLSVLLTLISLATLGYIDLKTYKIPNAVLIAWVLSIIYEHYISTIPLSTSSIILAIVIAGIYIPLRQVVRCSAGDFKLFAVIMLATGPQNTLLVCMLSMILSLIPLTCGLKKVPIAFTTFLAYTAFLFFK